jgi:hypothetical protein
MLKLEEILNIEYLAIAYDKKKRIEYYQSPTDPEKLAALEGCAVYCLRLCHSASQLAYAPAVKTTSRRGRPFDTEKPSKSEALSDWTKFPRIDIFEACAFLLPSEYFYATTISYILQSHFVARSTADRYCMAFASSCTGLGITQYRFVVENFLADTEARAVAH